MYKPKWRLSSALLLLIFSIPTGVLSEIYSYVDEHGHRHYTNAPVDTRYKLTNTEGNGGRKVKNFSSWNKDRIVEISIYDKIIESAAKRYRVDVALLKAIIQVESSFDRYAVSNQGARGLMQLMPQTAKELQVTDSFDPRQNIFGGSRYIKELLNKYNGNLSLSLAAYNAGPSRVAKNGTVPAFTETKKYVRRVLDYYLYYQHDNSMVSSIKVGEMVTVN
ncbi:MAG: lytic transglycosylase domain-containing protein [Desulfobulbaceae bacterium]|nr:lytic transglycosylase domain-containing protein [Desulfobulbaceae bacterium]